MINCIKYIKRICKRYTEIENYEIALNDKTQTWVCHHRREVQDGFRIWTKEELIKVGQYYHREPNELIFMTKSEHTSLHNLAIDPKTKKPWCVRNIKGSKNPMYGKKWSEEKRAIMAEKFKGPKLGLRKKSLFCQKYGMTKRELADKYNLPVGSLSYLLNKGILDDKIKNLLGG